MLNLSCLIAVSLVVASHQRVLSTTSDFENDLGVLDSSDFVDNANHRWHQNISITKEPAAVDSIVNPVSKKKRQCRPCSCGVLGKKLGIIGGNSTYVYEYPWMALVLIYNQFYCGGSLINDRYVLTAAHCVKGWKKEQMTVRLLEYDRSITNESKSKDYYVSKIIMHRDYVSVEKGYDIALLRLAPKVIITRTSKIKPVCLPEKSESYEGSLGIVIGWGKTSVKGPNSDVLLQVNVPIISNGKCNASYSLVDHFISDSMLCDGYQNGGKDSCQGDSGGPLHIVDDEEIYHIVGIVSWSIGCANPEFPGVNTRVSAYLDWLAFNTQDACTCDGEKP